MALIVRVSSSARKRVFRLRLQLSIRLDPCLRRGDGVGVGCGVHGGFEGGATLSKKSRAGYPDRVAFTPNTKISPTSSCLRRQASRLRLSVIHKSRSLFEIPATSQSLFALSQKQTKRGLGPALFVFGIEQITIELSRGS